MKILITGATGFVGGNLLRMLANGTNEIIYISRGGKPAPAAEGLPNVTCVTGDVIDLPSLKEACKEVDWVFHSAAMVSSLERQRAQMVEVNVTGTKNILQAALENRVQCFVHISSVDTVGMNEDGSPANEDTVYNFDKLRNPYSDTKTAAEKEVFNAVEKGLHAVIVNPGFMIGAWDVKGSSSRIILEVMKGKGQIATHGGNCFVDVEDVCRGAILAAEKGKSGERYILGGHNLNYLDFFTQAAIVCNKPKPWLVVPNWAAKAVGYIVENTALFFGKKPLVSKNEVIFSLLPHYYSSEKAIRELGYQISPLAPSIERARNWFIENNGK
jgi:dihydroflavonol-4-reductase